MAFQLVRDLFGRGSPPRNRTHGPIMGNAAFGDQKGETTHDLRDVENSAAELNWSQLARAPNGREMTEIEGRSSHRNTDKIVHRRGSNIHTYIARLE